MVTPKHENNIVRLHVHWGMKIAAIYCVILGFFSTVFFVYHGYYFLAFFYLPFTLLGVWVFYLADTKIEADHELLRAITPHGIYEMHWNEVISVERKKRATIFFGEGKAIGYNLLFAGKGKRELDDYVQRIIDEWQFEKGRPKGISNSEIRKIVKKSKVGKGKFY